MVGGPASLWTAASAVASDRYTIDERGIPSAILMERAALCVSHEVMALRGPGAQAVGVVVGLGHNGGDGLAVARQLRGWGVPVGAWVVDPRRHSAMESWLSLARAYDVPIFEGTPPDDEAARIWVDGLLGTGSRGALRGPIKAAATWLAQHRPRCVAIDIPTGVDPDTGAVDEAAVRAECTVTFARSKPGLHITPGRAHAGRVVIADIGLLPPPSPDESVELLDPRVVAEGLRRLPAGSHKGQRGHVAIIGGSEGTAGAALLAGGAAFRAGAGLVTVVSPDPRMGSLLVVARPELMTAPLAEPPALVVPRAGVIVVGPGLTDPGVHNRLASLYLDDPRPALWDASALDHIPLPIGRAKPLGPRVLTPHPGEAARLMARIDPDGGWSTPRVQAERLAVVRRLADATAAVVVLKGEGSVVAQPGGTVAVAISGSATLATAGSGDVLSGIGGALLGRGMTPWSAATAAVHIHGVAGEWLDAGSMASDIAESIPSAIMRVIEDPDHWRWPTLRRG